MWGKFSMSGEQEASRIVEKKRERPSAASEALARLRLMEYGKWSRHLNQGTCKISLALGKPVLPHPVTIYEVFGQRRGST
jgi:hypothetical protein